MEMSAMRFRAKPDPRRQFYLALIAQVETALRAAYGKRYEQGRTNQSKLSKLLKVARSTIHKKLTGRTNLTLKSIADLAWALDHKVSFTLADPELDRRNVATLPSNTQTAVAQPPKDDTKPNVGAPLDKVRKLELV
jgi:hypothetical protein